MVLDTLSIEEGRSSSSASSPLVDLFMLLRRKKRFLGAMALIGTLLAGGWAAYTKTLYTATALIMPPPRPQSLSAAFLGQLGAMAGSLSPALGLKDPADLYIGILKSRTLGDDLVHQFDLKKAYSVPTVSDARGLLLKHASFVSGRDSLIKISVEDTDPKRAAALANAFVAELYQQDNRLAVTESTQRKLFFERQLEEEEQVLARSETTLQQIQQKTGVVHASSQVQATIQSITRLKAEIAGREVALRTLNLGATAQNPKVVAAEAQLGAMRAHLSALESPTSAKVSGDPLIPFSRTPEAGLQVLRATRDVKYHEALLEALAKQYEIARIDDAKESQQIQVVDTAVPPEKKSWPPRLLLTLLGTISFTLLGCLFVFAQHSFSNQIGALRARPVTAD
jgi:tyrosine-protein kinase Etk/Wzc